MSVSIAFAHLLPVCTLHGSQTSPREKSWHTRLLISLSWEFVVVLIT